MPRVPCRDKRDSSRIIFCKDMRADAPYGASVFLSIFVRLKLIRIWQQLRLRQCGSVRSVEMKARNGWEGARRAGSGIRWLRRLWLQERRMLQHL